jgi:acetoin utilization protein AcuB
MFVRDWMSPPVIAISAGTSVVGALRVMEMNDVRRLPVLAGIVTREDLHSLLGHGEGLAQESAAPDDTLEAVAETMLEKKISGLPVLEGGRLVGMITESGIFRAFMKLLGLGESGARVVLSVPAGTDLAEAIRSLAATSRAGGGWDVVMRVRGRVLEKEKQPV